MTDNPTLQEGLIYLMVIISASDRAMNDKELARIGRLVQFLPVFEYFDENEVLPVAQRCRDLLAKPDGLNIALETIKNVLPKRLYDTAYSIAVEIAAADYTVRHEEIRVLQLVRDRLELDKLTCAAIEASAIARYKKVRN